jgi:anaerobic magnesium-protoporphyrin IX monomethyl ester cyclase
MKVVLIFPSFTEIYGDFRPAARVGVLFPPLGLLYLVAVLERAGHKVRIIDMEAELLDMDTLGKVVMTEKPDVVGVTCMTPLYRKACDIMDLVKRMDSGIKTLIGGPHPTSLPVETAMDCKSADFVVVGEAEETIVELLRHIGSGNGMSTLRGIVYRKNGKPIATPRRPLIKDLDSIPFPARHLIKQKEYLWSVPGRGIMPVSSMMTTRGCPFQCVFCSQRVIFGETVRYRSNGNVMEEIREVYHKHGIKHLIFDDDTLGINRERTMEFCDMLIEEKMDMTWEGMTRVNVVSRELLKKMHDAGLNRLSYGVESGDQNILNLAKKGTTLAQIRKAYELADSVGIETRMSIILGLPGETKESVRRTINFMKSLNCKQAYVNIGTPFPGTEFYDMAKNGEHGLSLITGDWNQYRRWGNAVINVNDLKRDDLIKYQRKALLEFYLRPSQIVYNLRRAGLKAAVRNGLGFAKSFAGFPGKKKENDAG